MKSTNNGTGIKLWAAALCGVLSVLIDFILIPQIFSLPPMLGLPDPIWMSMMILLPVLIAIHMLGQKAHLPAEYVCTAIADVTCYFYARNKVIHSVECFQKGGFATA